MKKTVAAVCIILVMTACLSACTAFMGTYDKSTNENVTVSVHDIKAEFNTAQITVSNGSSGMICFGYDFVIQKKVLLGWKTLDYLPGAAVSSVALVVEAGSEETFSLDWTTIYGKLKPGEYRFIRPYWFGTYDWVTGQPQNVYYMIGEFTIN